MTDPADVPIRDAATVVLLRDAATGIETWLLTRVKQMAFAAGMTVFPGGRVDDTDADLPFAGSDISELAARFACDETQTRALVGAALRETFEETGVLLSSPPADLADRRMDVESAAISFADLLRENGLSLDASGLRPWSRWVTPPGETRRYDTRFFLVALPDGAEAQDVTTESSSAAWVSVGDALEQAQRGERKLLPPTLATLSSLVPFTSVQEALDAASHRDLGAVHPNIRMTPDGNVVAELPDGTSISLPRTMFT